MTAHCRKAWRGKKIIAFCIPSYITVLKEESVTVRISRSKFVIRNELNLISYQAPSSKAEWREEGTNKSPKLIENLTKEWYLGINKSH